MSAANYLQAWQLLHARYDNKRLLINHHLNSLFNIQPLGRETERSLRFLVDHVTKNLRALTSLGQPTDKWDILIIFMLSSKLDQRTLIKWEELRNGLDDVPTLENFNKFLTDRADVLEALNRSSAAKPPLSRNDSRFGTSFNHNKNDTNFKNEKPHTKSFTSHVSKLKSSTKVCIICGGNHKVFECTNFKSMSLQDKWSEVKKYKLCHNCLRQGHLTGECRASSCRHCRENHSTLLHNSNSSSQNNENTNRSETVVTFSKQNNKQILLSTALIQVCNPLTKKTERVRYRS